MTKAEIEQKAIDFAVKYQPIDGSGWVSEEELRKAVSDYVISLQGM